MKQKMLPWRYGDLGFFFPSFFCAHLQALFCDINWVQRGIREGHIKLNYSATQECHYLALKPMGTLRRRNFTVMGRKMEY